MERDYKVNSIIFSKDDSVLDSADGIVGGGARWRGAGATMPATDNIDGDLFLHLNTGGGLHVYYSGAWYKYSDVTEK